MSVRSIEVLQRYLRRLCDEAVSTEDDVLLNRFVTANDREAFELLIARHGPMVLGTARRLVNNSHDAEDVFQAVFLSLGRLAKTIRQGRTLAAWLHKTTCRIAAKVRKNRISGSKEPPPEPCENSEPGAELVWREVRQALDEELQHLPERLRSPLLLCYLSGLTRDEAAKQLGWSLGTLKRRLEEGRKTLRNRLAKRGIVAVGLALTVLTPGALRAAVSKSLLNSSLSLIFSTGAAVPTTISALVVSSATTTKGVAMKALLALLAVVALGVGVYAGMGRADPPTKVEGKKDDVKPAPEDKVGQMDDPLPAGSTLRFGTSRFRHGGPIECMAVAADGKTAYVVSGTRSNGSVRAIDLVSGRIVFELAGVEAEAIVVSPDGRTIVTKSNLRLYVRDSKSGQELRSIDLPKANPRSADAVLVFTPDGKALATISDSKDVHLIDLESGKVRDFSHVNPESGLPSGFEQVLAIAFTADGKRMATGGYGNDKGNYFARLWDVETGKELRRFMHGQKGYGIRSLAFSPDGKTLATLGTQGGAFLRLFDVDTGNERKAFPKDGNGRPNPGSVAFAPDGKTVAAASDSIRLYDPTTGEERLCIDRSLACGLHFTDEGKTLTGAVGDAVYRWDTATGKMLTPDAADSIVEQILVSADGSRVVTRGQDGYVHIWDGANGKHLRRLQGPWQRGMAISPDGRFLAWPVRDEKVTYPDLLSPNATHDGSRIRLYDLAADKQIDRFPGFKGDAKDMAFTGDGKQIVTVDQHGGAVRIWNVEAGKEERSFQAVPDALKQKSYQVVGALLSPDGKTAALTYAEVAAPGGVRRLGMPRERPHVARLWDVATGKELPALRGDPLDRAFSPDGRLVFTNGGNSIFEIATGDRVSALSDDLYVRAAAFSRDSRFLATVTNDGVIQIWEVATWTKRSEFKSYQYICTTLTFGPAGQLFSGYVNTTVLAWDTRPPRAAASVSLETAWADLAKREAADAFKSEEKFLSAPAEAVKLFAEKIKCAEAIDPKRVQSLLADLGSDDFATREAASKALAGLDEQAIPYLEDTLKSTESAEVRLRVKRLVEQRKEASLTSDQIRQVRAVMVLERIGDGGAKDLLQRWATGAGRALLTTEAVTALKRLKGASTANQ